jgi:CCR4-NOT transcription complex subunit 1
VWVLLQVFKATNPMIAGILSLMAEIHSMPRLKLNISFVIEMTFKTFEVALSDVCPSTALRDLPRVQVRGTFCLA